MLSHRIPSPDIWLAILALPIFLIAGWPLLGWAAAVGAWVVQRLLQVAIQRRSSGSDDPRTVVGLAAGSMLARAWLVALAVFAAGLVDRPAGLAAALLAIALFTAYFATQMITRPLVDREARP